MITRVYKWQKNILSETLKKLTKVSGGSIFCEYFVTTCESTAIFFRMSGSVSMFAVSK